MVPPTRGRGWAMSVAKGASGWPSFRRASRLPAGPWKWKLRMAAGLLEVGELVSGKSDLSAPAAMPDFYFKLARCIQGSEVRLRIEARTASTANAVPDPHRAGSMEKSREPLPKNA